jgi:TRAP-type uncharacterized transport system fused permease subunit
MASSITVTAMAANLATMASSRSGSDVLIILVGLERASLLGMALPCST